jgi:type I restriction enzyme S subunit
MLMSRKVKDKLIPSLRFPEFQNSGKWPYEKGDLLFDQITNKDHNSDLPILAITQEQGAIPRDQIDYNVVVTDKSLESYKVVEVGDFIISLRSFQGGIEYSNYKGICSPAYVILRRKTESISDFFKHYFKTRVFIQDLNKNLEGLRDGKMVSYKQFSDLMLPSPSPKEQQKIGDCLSSLDELITAENKKLEALKAHKKGLMQQLFPAEGEKVPKLRFKEFRDSGEWGEKQLKDVCKMQAGKFASASEIIETKSENYFPCYGGNGLRGYTKSFTHSGEYSLIGRQGALCGNVTLATGKFYATEHAVVSTPEKGVDTIWLFYMLNHLNLNQHATGQAQPGLSVETLEKVKVQISESEKEQKEIADCLSSADELITSQSQRVETFKVLKKGLMQQLFPKLTEVSE